MKPVVSGLLVSNTALVSWWELPLKAVETTTCPTCVSI
jgi:hypothetical protein